VAGSVEVVGGKSAILPRGVDAGRGSGRSG
jgi:hypothetical protein